MANIHPTAVVDPGAKLADDVTVGPLSTIGSEVELGAGRRDRPAGVHRGPHADRRAHADLPVRGDRR